MSRARALRLDHLDVQAMLGAEGAERLDVPRAACSECEIVADDDVARLEATNQEPLYKASGRERREAAIEVLEMYALDPVTL